MGHIIKKIVGDFDNDPYYDKLTVEDNENGQIHIHAKNIRLDMYRPEYNVFYRALKEAYKNLNEQRQ
jgi:hypothetical protein|tara:strand:- start:127 stop:327 length:201 start_codon:yes stop_codon:yes gene_type:complete